MPVFPHHLQEQINKAIVILKKGGLVAYPTDTVYGLGANMTRTSAIERIFTVKERPTSMALPLLVADYEQLKQVVKTIPPDAWRLIYNFLPGALTLVLAKAENVPGIITGGGQSVAVRIPNHPVPIALIRGLGKPIVGTSANLSGKPSPLTASEVRAQIGDKIDMVIDGGKSPGGLESTVVDWSGKKPVVRRVGAITLEELKHSDPNIDLAEEAYNASRNR